jgi:hypothetical protein
MVASLAVYLAKGMPMIKKLTIAQEMSSGEYAIKLP